MVFSALMSCPAPSLSVGGIGGSVSCAAASFLTFSVPMYILTFAVVFIVLGKVLNVTQQLAAMVFLTSATAAFLLLTAQITVGAIVTMSDIVFAAGLVFAGFVLPKVAKIVGL